MRHQASHIHASSTLTNHILLMLVAMLVEFYTSRLADEESVEAVLSGMLVFQRFDGFDVNQAMKLLTR
jgi:hypothetical protein